MPEITEEALARFQLIELRARDVITNVASIGMEIVNRPGMKLVHAVYVDAMRDAIDSGTKPLDTDG